MADIYKAGILAARLERHEGGTRFSYLPAYLASGGPAVASSLPLSTQPVLSGGGAAPPYFTGLLPDAVESIAAQLRRNAEMRGDRPALISVDDGRSLTNEIWRTFLVLMALAIVGEALLCMPGRREIPRPGSPRPQQPPPVRREPEPAELVA